MRRSGHTLGYKLHMQSPEWRATRKFKLQQVGHKCQGCGSQERLQVHHLTYERFGHERLTDLQVLCHLCHAKAHGMTPDVGPIAGPTVKEQSRVIKLREALEKDQGQVAIAAQVAEQAEAFAALVETLTGDLSPSAYKRCKLIEKELGKLIAEILPVVEAA